MQTGAGKSLTIDLKLDAMQNAPALRDRRRIPRIADWALIVILPAFFLAFRDFFAASGWILLLTPALAAFCAHMIAMRRIERICAKEFREQICLSGWPARDFVQHELRRAQISGASAYKGLLVLWLLALIDIGGNLWLVFVLWVAVALVLQILLHWSLSMQVYVFCNPGGVRLGPWTFFIVSALIYVFGPWLMLMCMGLVALPIVTIPLVPWMVYGVWMIAAQWRTKAIEQYYLFE